MQQLKSGSLLQGGKYRIEKVLGQGGFGITYLATQELLDRKVCIKEFFFKDSCVRTQAGAVALGTVGNKELVERFLQKFIKEAKTISRLDHPNIIRILDVFKENGTAYYVMDFIEGGSLEQKVKQNGALPENEAINYIKQAAKALEYLHQRRISHLDIKPANIMVRKEDNRAILVDFGVSKQYNEQGEQTSTTPVGVSHGYAPMEQYNIGGASNFLPQADIYSLGATLYKLVTGITPPHAIDVFNNGLPSLPSHLSTKIVGIINEVMRPKSDDRPKSVSFLVALPNQQNDESTRVIVVEPVNKSDTIPQTSSPTHSTKSFWKRRLPLGVGVVAVLVIFLYTQKGQTDGVPMIGVSSLIDSTWNPVILDSEELTTTTLLSINTSPSGASVYMDGQDIGTTPIDREKVPHGQHIVKIIKNGYEPITKSFSFSSGPARIDEILKLIDKYKFNTKHYSLSEDTKDIKYNLEIDYPVEGNDTLLKRTREMITSCLLDYEIDNSISPTEILKMYEEELKKDWYNSDLKCEIEEKYLLGLNKKEILTYELSSYRFLEGSAHGSFAKAGITYRKDNGNRLGWNMFTSTSVLKDIIIDELKQQYFEVKNDEDFFDLLFLNDTPNRSNFPLPRCEPWITSEGIVFQYGEYEIAAYAQGLPYCIIPFHKLTKYLNTSVRNIIEREFGFVEL